MRILVMTDIEGVTGVTTFPQAESSEFGRDMLMNDLQAVLAGIRDAGAEAVIYDMHTDGRNVRLGEVDAPVVMGKPIDGRLYRGVGQSVDALFLLGLHTMQHTGALLAHSYLREYDAIYINGILIGEIGVEAALAGEQGIPLAFVSGDDKGCEEAAALIRENSLFRTEGTYDRYVLLSTCVDRPENPERFVLLYGVKSGMPA